LNTKDLWKNSSNNFIILYTIKGLLSQDEARLLNIGGLAFCNIQ
jgi:ribosomal protein S8